ncbi:hypothetical protein SAMN03080598_02978 [Algoriphagus boritolerans DSM 17298 = JCM 18970]|uniref:Uncharacterized protein n=1 Tax=Algoriphagus boritolerans DSM 17298 = JCM 18970 TaxID=1120964 RepID=A0A1H5YH02_9BACT|nr:hypothetical protein SAMN03080598_02978 [Algoriphagus boritolerans DSM 17298 = JCM 18970]
MTPNFFMKKLVFLNLFFTAIFYSCGENSTIPFSKDSSKTDTLIFYSENEIIDLGEEG